MPELIEPSADLHSAWLDAHREWGPGLHEDGFGIGPADEVDSAEGFAAWLARLGDQSDARRTIDIGRHRCTYRWIVEDRRVLGGIALRDGDDEYTRRAGNIGYGIRPSERRRGLATWAVAQILDMARERGMRRVLAVCALDNSASFATIERSSGVLEAIGDSELGPVRRYWIELSP